MVRKLAISYPLFRKRRSARRYSRFLPFHDDRGQPLGKIIDLGCGPWPLPGAHTAVDAHVEAVSRSGGTISAREILHAVPRFVIARIDEPLPFEDKYFDFVYSSHAVEHTESPETALKEMMRVGRRGVIICPSFFGEMVFGRPYHRWIVHAADSHLYLFEKPPVLDRPFGSHPNPFDKALNDGGWYHGRDHYPGIEDRLRSFYFGHHPLIETVFWWHERFDFTVHRRADRWATYAELKPGYFQPLSDLFKRRASATSALARGKTLEVGCGNGLMSAFLVEHVDRLIGIDDSAEAVRLARAKYLTHKDGSPVEFVVMDARTLHFPDSSFDTVVIAEVIEHLTPDALGMAMSECIRVVKHTGRIVISTPIGFMPDIEHKRGYTKADFQAFLERHGRLLQPVVTIEGIFQIGAIQPYRRVE